MLSTLITSKTRIKLLFKFFINHEVQSYLRNLENEFKESCNAIRTELNRFESAGLLSSSIRGNRKYYMANTNHPIYNDLNIFLLKIIGIDNIKYNIITKIPELEAAYLGGKLAQGIESQIVDLILIGENLDKKKISKLCDKFEKEYAKKIRYLILEPEEKEEIMSETKAFLIWEKDS